MDNLYLLIWYTEKNTTSLCGIPAQNAQLESNYEETLDKPKLRDILQNNWPVLSKNIKKNKEV